MTYYPGAIMAIAQSEATRRMVQAKVDTLAYGLRAGAPVRTGAGRASITAKTERDFEHGWVGTATWDEEHYYMGILNSRTRWADPTVAAVRYV